MTQHTFLFAHNYCSVREVEVIVGIVIILSLSNEGTDSVESEWEKGDSAPNSNTVVHNVSLDEEFSSSTVKEMEKPLLSSVGSMMPDVASAIT